MLFDLQSGKRRRLVQVVYSFLAASFLIGFVIFGVGSGGIGSISDIFGGGSSSAGDVASQFDDQIATAQSKLAKDPKDQRALASLAKYQYYKGRAELGPADPSSGQPFTVTDTARSDLGEAVDSWEKYLDVADKPDAGNATILVQAYIALNDAAGAARTQEIVAQSKPSASSYGNLALYLYFSGKIKAGDAAAAKAVAEAPASERKSTQDFVDQARKQGVKIAKAQKQAGQAGATGSAPNPLDNPFGGLGGAGSTP